MRASELVAREFIEYVEYAAKRWYPKRAIVLKAVLERFAFHPSGMLLFLETYSLWKDHFYSIEKELIKIDKEKEEKGDFQGRPVFVIVPKKNRGSFVYRIQSIPVCAQTKYSNRLDSI